MEEEEEGVRQMKGEERVGVVGEGGREKGKGGGHRESSKS